MCNTIIDVPWQVDGWLQNLNHTIVEGLVISRFASTFQDMPWADFLVEHAQKIQVEITGRHADTFICDVSIQFHLPSEQATMYRLRFS